MNISVTPITVKEVLPYRDLYRQEMNCQIVHDSYHSRGFTTMHLLRIGESVAGYGCVTQPTQKWLVRGIVKEFYVLPAHRGAALPLFRALVAATDAHTIEAQTNDRLLMFMLWDTCGPRITSETVLFEDGGATALGVPGVAGAAFRRIREDEKERVFKHKHEPVGDWVVEAQGAIVATGGFLCHYNPPYGDVYMEVDDRFHRRGYGSYLVQEVKRVCYEAGKRPAARCGVKNIASRSTLQKAGFVACARIVKGKILKTKAG